MNDTVRRSDGTTSRPPAQMNKLTRLRARLHDPVWRKYGYALFAGKALGIALVFGVMILCSSIFGTDVRAEDPALAGNDIVNPINTVWTLVAAFLVFGMQVGFTMLEAGFCRSRETVNVLMECIVDTCLCGLLFYAWGFAFMFGSGTPFIGTEYFFLQGAPATYGSTGVPFLAFWLFQFAFADTCSTITSGAMIGRTGFVGDLLYSVGVSGFIYPIIGHWAWGPDGLLATMGSEGNFLAGARDELPRLRRLDRRAHDRRLRRPRRRDRARPAPRTSLQARRRRPDAAARPDDRRRRRSDPLVRLVRLQPRQHAVGDGLRGHRSSRHQHHAGGLRGRPDGDVLRLPEDQDVGRQLHGQRLPRRARRDHLPLLLGVADRAPSCSAASPASSWCSAVDVLEWLRIDDPIGAVPVHGICGIWGTLSLGLFACGQYGATGPIGAGQLGAADGPLLRRRLPGAGRAGDRQRRSSRRRPSSSSLVLMYAVNALGVLRVSTEGELEGLDLHEHGVPAYPEYALHLSATPSGAPAFMEQAFASEKSRTSTVSVAT